MSNSKYRAQYAKTYSSGNQKKTKKFWAVGSVLFFVLLIAFGIASDNTPRNSYLKEIKIIRATIAEQSAEDGKFYIRVTDTNQDPIKCILFTDPWVEVSSDFFLKHRANTEVGLLAGNYDIFKARYLGLFGEKGQTYEDNSWAVDEVYDSYDAAVSANPSRQFTENALLVKKKITKSGKAYFILNAKDRKFNIPVTREVYERYGVNSTVRCNFEAVGDFIKIIKAGV
jgi:hypothetical protein